MNILSPWKCDLLYNVCEITLEYCSVFKICVGEDRACDEFLVSVSMVSK